MKKARNKVIAGDYKGTSLDRNGTIAYPMLPIPGFNNILKKPYVVNYEVINADEFTEVKQKNSILKAFIGENLIGPAGLLAGVKREEINHKVYTVAVFFKSGKKSLIEIDEKLYKKFLEDMF